MLWHLIVFITINLYESASNLNTDCTDRGDPCIAAVQAKPCDDYGAVKLIREIPDFDEEPESYPWSFESGTTRTLCCGTIVMPPLLESTVQMEWIYYEKVAYFGREQYKILENTAKHIINEEETRAFGHYSLLTITNITTADKGIYMCRASAITSAPPGEPALTLAKLFDPFVISVYSPTLSFKFSTYAREVELGNTYSEPYAMLSYALDSVNPDKIVVVSVTTNEDLFQWIDVKAEQKLIVNPYGSTEYNTGSGFPDQNFAIEIYYEGEKGSHSLTRDWVLSGSYAKQSHTVFVPTEDSLPSPDGYKYKATITYPFYVVGSCARFKWEVKWENSALQELTFDGSFSDSFKTISEGGVNVDYRFADNYTTGDLETKNAYLEAKFYRTSALDEDITAIRLVISCATGSCSSCIQSPEYQSFDVKGLPVFANDTANCIFASSSSWGPENDVTMEYPVPTVTRKSTCCDTVDNKYSANLFVNGEFIKPDGGDKGPWIDPLHTNEQENAKLRYDWFQNFTGYYQCLVTEYLSGMDSMIPQTKSRDFKIGFKVDVSYTIEFQSDDFKGYINTVVPTVINGTDSSQNVQTNVSKYITRLQNLNEFLVVDNTCLNLVALEKSYPRRDIEWETTLDVNNDKGCSDPHRSDQGQNKDNVFVSYEIYDRVEVVSSVFIGPVIYDSSMKYYQVKAKLDEAPSVMTPKLKIYPMEPYLEKPKITENNTTFTIKCEVSGYPIDSVKLMKEGDKTPVAEWSLIKSRSPEVSRTGYKVTLTAAPVTKRAKYTCTAVNSILSPAFQTKSTSKDLKPLRGGSSDTVLLIACAIGILIICIMVWVICGCIRKARTGTKLGQAMCCFKSKYTPIGEKMAMKDPLLLDYSTLNPGITLGGGHFGIVRRGYCSHVPDRLGEKTTIAIKEVKPCNDRSKRDDDLRTERDIMLTLRGHRNVIKIFGYTDEPDTLALVIEFAQHGSLDKLLINARTIKSDGYVLPNEHNDNPIEAFEAKHIMEFSRQIADGMDYVGRNKIVHRDLAARNIVVAGDEHEYILKITDFGLAREISSDGIYQRFVGKEIPIKWTAPDSLQNDIYTAKSDVWSYGVTLWELCTLGGEPYHGIPNSEVMIKLRSGFRLQKPPTCHKDMYSLMNRCWEGSPDDRPQFSEILTQLTEYCQAPSQYLRIEDLYESDLDLTLKLHTLSQPAHSPSNGSRELPRDQLTRELSRGLSRDPSRDSEPAANEYSPDPLPDNAI